MVTLSKIYTKTGDTGMTSLGDGKRVQKDSKRVATYGTVDELNSCVGLARIHCSEEITDKLRLIQNDLFDLGADFCKPYSKLKEQDKNLSDIRITNEQVQRIEKEIDEMTSWVVKHLGPDVPMHFSAFHPDWKMMDKPRTPKSTLARAREIALANGVRYAYTGNIHDFDGHSTY
mgnify:CR=1 FL=1